MDIDSILDDDDLDIQILEVKCKNDSVIENPAPIIKKETKNNPVEEHLIKQLNCVHNQIHQTNNNIEHIQNVTEKIIQNLASQAAYREDASSDSDSDMYSSTGEPIIKKKKNRFYKRQQVLVIEDTWQRIIDDKWIIGVILHSTTTCVLKEPTIYVCLKNCNDDGHGVSIFWTLVDDTFWFPTEEIQSEERLVATVTLDLPSFNGETELEAHGTIFCQFEDKLFQTPLPDIKLSVQDTINGSYALDLDDENNAPFSILALKAISVDKIVLLPVHEDSNVGKRLMDFLEKYPFREVCKTCVARNAGSLQYCVFQVLPYNDEGDVRVFLSARSEAQLSLVVQLMRLDFPELVDDEKQQVTEEAAMALREELQLYLTCNDAAELQRARIRTDLLIP